MQASPEFYPGLRAELHAAIKARHLSHAAVVAELNVSKGSICGWLWPRGEPPSAANISKIRPWLDKAALETQTPVAALDDWPALREQLRGVVRERALSHAELAAVFGSSQERSGRGSHQATRSARQARASSCA